MLLVTRVGGLVDFQSSWGGKFFWTNFANTFVTSYKKRSENIKRNFTTFFFFATHFWLCDRSRVFSCVFLGSTFGWISSSRFHLNRKISSFNFEKKTKKKTLQPSDDPKLTLKRLFRQMQIHVLGQRRTIVKGFSTGRYFTDVWFFSYGIKCYKNCCWLHRNIYSRFFTRVYSHMQLKTRLLRESFRTDLEYRKTTKGKWINNFRSQRNQIYWFYLT